MIRCTWPSAASRSASPSGRSSTATAPSRLSATTSASALGRARHQHADVLALAHADRDQAADDVVDPLVDLAGGVGAVLEQEEDLVGGAPRPLLDEQPERDPGARLHLLEPDQPRQLTGRLARQLPHAACGACAVNTADRAIPAPTAPASSRP